MNYFFGPYLSFFFNKTKFLHETILSLVAIAGTISFGGLGQAEQHWTLDVQKHMAMCISSYQMLNT